MPEMNVFINQSCERFADQRSKEKGEDELTAMTYNGDTSMKLKMVFEKQGIPVGKEICIRGFKTALENCTSSPMGFPPFLIQKPLDR